VFFSNGRVENLLRHEPFLSIGSAKETDISNSLCSPNESVRTAGNPTQPNSSAPIRGVNILFNELQQQPGQDRLHQFVRSLEALILPDVGNTKHQFAHRCQTFARGCADTRATLLENLDMRSDTEHLQSWDRTVQGYPTDQRENVCWQRTRQIEHLAGDVYSRLLCEAALRDHFRTDDALAAFWKMREGERHALW
jgi:hypothetical protein